MKVNTSKTSVQEQKLTREDCCFKNIEEALGNLNIDVHDMEKVMGVLKQAKHEVQRKTETLKSEVRALKYDDLGGALTRKFFDMQVKEKACHPYQDSTIIYADLNDLKTVNDQIGHETGDEYIEEFVLRVKSVLRDTDELIRYGGGDEFIIAIPKESNADEVIKRIEEKLAEQPFERKNKSVVMTAAMGHCANTDLPLNKRIKEADKMMYENKEKMKKNKEKQEMQEEQEMKEKQENEREEKNNLIAFTKKCFKLIF